MRRFPLFLSAAVVPLLLAATPAFALTNSDDSTGDEVQGDSSADTDTADTDTNADSVSADAAKTGIVVSGIRQSLESAQSIKRNSDSILDAIVAEDIGKLPDNTAAESIARIAGVQVTRFSDEASGVLIRGLPDVATSYNGREIFTAELRRVQLQDFPAQALAGIEVYKSGTADIIEPGLAGLVNVRTRRPFDFKDQVIAGGFHGTYNDQSRKFDPSGNLLFSDRWDAGDGEIGLLANVTFAQSQYYNGVRYNSTWIQSSFWSDIGEPGVNAWTGADVPVFRFPNNIGLYNDGGRRYRPSGNFALQWAPNTDVELYVEGIYQGYRGNSYADNFDVPIENWGPDGPPVLDNIVLIDGTDQAASLTKTGGNDPLGYRNTGKDATNTYQIATGGTWNTGMLKLSADIAYSWSEYHRDRWSVDFITNGARDLVVDFNKDGGVAFDLPGWDISDPANYNFRGYWNETFGVEGDGWQARADLEYETDWDFLKVIQAGIRWTDRNSVQIKYGTRYGWVVPLEIPFSDLPVGDLQLTTDPFRGNAQGFTQYLSIPRNGIVDNAEALRQFTYDALGQLVALNPGDQGYLDAYQAFSTPEIQLDPSNAWNGQESTYAAYVQAKYGFALGMMDVDGVVGVRLVQTEGSTYGISTVRTCDYGDPYDTTDDVCDVNKTPQLAEQSYFDVLPNVSLRLKITPELQLRFGYTETRTKPEFRDLNPALFINPVFYDPDIPQNPGITYPDYTGSSGNPNLKPFTSNNFDVSLEYYFSRTGYVSLAGFYRDLYGFTTWVERFVDDPVYGTLRLNSPINAADGSIKGFEINAQTFLDFLPSPWDGFGIQANVTYLTGKSRYPNGYNAQTDMFEGEGEYLKITGLSDWTFNVAAFYEKDGVTARISYNQRSDWVNGYVRDLDNGDYAGNGTQQRDRLDASISYDINKNFTVYFDVSNILARPFMNYTQYEPGRTFPIDVRDEGRYYGFGFRFRFGE